jgi:sigma-E factor negative regulatory protein RseA
MELDEMNSDDDAKQHSQRQALSALMDGEGSDAELACKAWREDADLRADWHAYHLIGEAMRSNDIRCAPLHDARFLDGLRECLGKEPVILAPVTPAAPRRGDRRRTWAAPAAVAAGFFAVAGVLVVMRTAGPAGATPDASAQLASEPRVPVAQAVAASAGMAGNDSRLIRNAELDRYLAAHRQYGSTSALAVPGGTVRNAAAAAPDR